MKLALSGRNKATILTQPSALNTQNSTLSTQHCLPNSRQRPLERSKASESR
jgi:hypothetical protein